MKNLAIFAIVSVISIYALPVFAMDNLPTKTGLNVSVGGEYAGFNVVPEGSVSKEKAGYTAGYAGVSYAFKNFDIGVDLGGASVTADNVFAQGADYSSTALFVRPTVKTFVDLSESLKLGGSLSYLFIGKSDDQRTDNMFGADVNEKVTLGITQAIKLNAPTIQWSPAKGLSLYGGFAARFARMNDAKFEATATLNGSTFQNSASAGISTKKSVGGTAGAIYDFGKVSLGLQGDLLTQNGSGVNGSLTYHF